jgi:hypothetical protein
MERADRGLQNGYRDHRVAMSGWLATGKKVRKLRNKGRRRRRGMVRDRGLADCSDEWCNRTLCRTIGGDMNN